MLPAGMGYHGSKQSQVSTVAPDLTFEELLWEASARPGYMLLVAVVHQAKVHAKESR